MSKGVKRPQNCFRCWHCRAVDGMRNICICVYVMSICVYVMSKTNPPELILKPYSGICPAFYDKALEERSYDVGDDEDD